MKTRWMYAGLAGALALSLLAGCGKSEETAGGAGGEQAAAGEVQAVAVNVEAVKEGTLGETNKLTGEAAANTSISILPKVSGTIVELSVKKGDRVKNGQVIGRLDQTDYQLGVKQAEAALGVANANLGQAKSGTNIDIAGTSYELARRGMELAQQTYDRTKALVDANAAPKSQLEQAESVLIQAKNALNQAAKGDAQSTASVQVAEAGVRQAQVGVERARVSLQDTLIKATANGIITDIPVEVGDTVNPQMPVASLINIDPALISLNVSESNLSKFKAGSQLDVTVPSQKLKVKGTVSFVGLEADPASRLFPVELKVANPKQAVLPGMKVEVEVKDLVGKKGLILPTDAIIELDGKKYVYVVEGDRALKREIVLSDGNTSYVFVESGVKAGEQVVIKGQSQLKDQAKVRIVK